MSWTDLMVTDEPSLSSSELERARFGYTFDRAVVPEAMDREVGRDWLTRALSESGADIVVARYPSRYVEWFADLRTCGRDLLHADTLVYWQMGLDPIPETMLPRHDDAVTVEDHLDATTVEHLVLEGFADYPSHYRANPLLDPDAIRDGYVEWATSIARSGDGFGLRHRDHGVVGFAVQTPSTDHAEVLLAAVRPHVRGVGLYHHAFAACARRARERGLRRLVSSTQAHNLAGQRAWTRFGLEPVGAFTTVHAVRPGLLRPSLGR